MRFLLSILLVCCCCFACREEEDPMPTTPLSEDYQLKIPQGFPNPDIPEGNELTTERIQLGKQLFYDPILSRDSSISCASCHKAAFAFADNLPTSPGVDNAPGTRNSTSLTNVAYQNRMLREGSVPTIEQQILVPIQEHNEFDFNMVEIIERLKQQNDYVQMAKEAYDREIDPFVLTRSIAAFERTLISGNSPYDQFVFQNQENALSEAQKRGKTLFESEQLNCNKCHSDFNFTNGDFTNNGLYEVYPDSGRIRFTFLEEDRAVFKVPSLRNIELTGPYMHDGSMDTLEEIIEHYANGGSNHPNKNDLIKGFEISEEEKNDLEEFLRSLTDWEFINNPNFRL